MDNKYHKRYIFGTVLSILGILVIHYFINLYDTRGVMQDLNLVAQGGKALSKENDIVLQNKMPFKNKERLSVSKIKRHLSLCFGDRGKIWLHYSITTRYSDDETVVSPMYDQVLIKRKNGKWVITDYIYEP